ncbi:MAG: DUF302 domain-containing protein [Chitinophagaceae bacterium]|nr:DUF302 domain-containing protein [Chitinophagaceae bacterium]
MSYCFSKVLNSSFDDAVAKVTEGLAKEGFGVLNEIDMTSTLKKKLDVDIRKYKILGACNPKFAYQALQAESEIGTMLPCNVVVQETEGGIKVSAIDPVASMMAIKNDNLGSIAGEVRAKLERVVENL